jgi:hypothetical protein
MGVVLTMNTDITHEMIQNADHQTLLRYDRELTSIAEQIEFSRRQELGRVFRRATRDVARAAQSNGNSASYVSVATDAPMPDWLKPWLPTPEVRRTGRYLVHIEQMVPGAERSHPFYLNSDGTAQRGRLTQASVESTVGDFLQSRLPSDLYEQVRVHIGPWVAPSDEHEHYNLLAEED